MEKKNYLKLSAFFIGFLLVLSSNQSKACYATFTHTYACAGDTIFFNAADQYAVYTWDFGDSASGVANISHDTDAVHVYTTPGTYFVSLFVNIGASWDYRTEIITIGTDCFNAAFSSTCSGSNWLNFKNESTGHYTSSSWDFGDTASATNNSTLTNPSHSFSASGTYSVTLITSDSLSLQSDTIIQIVNVDANCLNATFYNQLSGDCVQDTTLISPSISGNPTSYLWDFGDTASGAANTSTATIGQHLFSSTGIFLVTLTISDSTHSATFYILENIIDCTVYPGNANRDGEVNMEDLFAIGIFYGNTGSARLGATMNWNSQPATNWNTSGYTNLMYLQSLVDKKNADCNGDGIVDMNDVLAIQQNYGNKVPNYRKNDRMSPVKTRSTDPTLQVINGWGTYNAGDVVSLPIDLSAATSVQNVYGFAARLYYDAAYVVPGTLSITYSNSWLGNDGYDMITLKKDFPADGYVDFGMVRNTRTKVSGNGQIAQLNFILRSSVIGTMNFTFDPLVKLISNGNSNGNQEIFYPVNVASSSMINVLAGVKDISSQQLSIYPNPVKDVLRVNLKNNENIQTWMIIDALGKVCLQGETGVKGSNEQLINTSELAEGVYSLKIITAASSYSKQIVVGR